MKYERLNLENIQALEENTALCLGTFDGVHLGHQSLINKGKSLGLNIAVFVIEPDFAMFTNKNYLNSPSDQKEIFEKLGVSHCIVATLDDKLRNLSPKEFIEKILEKLNPSAIIVGKDYRFGHFAKGDAKLLKEYFKEKIDIYVMPPIMASKDEKISTTLIKSLIKKGMIEEANEYLSREYFISGIVTKGSGVGKKLGFPTANIEPSFPYVIPKNGVYHVKVLLNDEIKYGLVNIGHNPTINMTDSLRIETHIFDFNANIYGEELRIYFLKFIRDEKKFSSKEELIKQLQNDLETYKNGGK